MSLHFRSYHLFVNALLRHFLRKIHFPFHSSALSAHLFSKKSICFSVIQHTMTKCHHISLASYLRLTITFFARVLWYSTYVAVVFDQNIVHTVFLFIASSMTVCLCCPVFKEFHMYLHPILTILGNEMDIK